jgi:hypothetical protein
MRIEEVKSSRVTIDGIFKLINTIGFSRELSLAITEAQRSKMWLGQALKAMDAPNPYPESKDPNSQVIAPTADVSTVVDYTTDQNTTIEGFPWLQSNHVSRVKFVRQQIDLAAAKLVWNQEYNDGYAEWKKDEAIILAIRDARKHLTEAGMWLGMELGRIRDEELDKLVKAL